MRLDKTARALIERNHNRMGNSVAATECAKQHELKANYWESRKNDIDLSMPESVEYFEYKLALAEQHQAGLKNGSIAREHSFSLPYATKAVKELKSKVATAKELWA